MQTQGAAACGMCIEVLAVDNMPSLNDQLTKWDYKKNITVPFIAMIFDQCTDPICEWNGYLDFVSAILLSSALYVPQSHTHYQPLCLHERVTLPSRCLCRMNVPTGRVQRGAAGGQG